MRSPDFHPVTPLRAHSLSRRRLVQLGIGAGTALALPAVAATSAEAATDPYAALRSTWVAMMTGGVTNTSGSVYSAAIAGVNAQTQAWLSSIQTGSGATALWSDLPLGSVSANISTTFSRLKSLASAYVIPGTNYTGSSSLASTILAGLDFLAGGAYSPSTTPYDNWWDWQIGSSQILEDTAILMYAQLSASQIAAYCACIDAFVPDPTKQMIVSGGSTTSTGANRLDMCRAVIVRGALGEDSTAISTGVSDLIPELSLVMCGDGLYADGSFTQHSGVAYTGTYGAIYFGDIAAMVQLLAGSSWAIPSADLSPIVTGVSDGYAPMVYNGLMLDAVRGRAISRYTESDAADGFSSALTLLDWAEAVAATNPTQAAQWRSTAKGWLQRNTVYGISVTSQSIVNNTTGATVTVSAAGVAGIALAESVLGDSSVTAAAEPTAHQQFPNMARAVHRRPGWAYAVAMCSDEIQRYEVINGENLHGWYTGDGMGYLYLDTDVAQFNDAYWDTVDMYQLPGATADSGTLANSAGATTKPSTTWVGGSVLAGIYGAAGMKLQAYSTNLTAVKSWFCLDSQVVCLGAGITSTSGNNVLTTVENRNLHTVGNNTLYINGTQQSIGAGWSSTVSSVHSACLTGVAGYYFLWPAGANNVEFALTNQTGNWLEVNSGAPTTLADDTRPYLSIAFNHGANPSAATYSYVILPGATEAQTAAYAASPTVTVTANTASVQAISDATLGVTMANFYAAATAGAVTVNAPASVSTQTSGSELTIAVSDPTWTSATVQVTVAASGYAAIVAADPTVTVLSSTGGSITLLVETGGSRGATHSVTLSTGGTALTPATATLLTPTDDAYVRGGSYAADNYGTTNTMVIKNSTGDYDRVALLKFNTSTVTGTVRRAILWLNGNTEDSGGTQTPITAYELSSSSWSESTVTYNTAPSLTTTLGTGSLSNTYDWVGLDVTAAVSAAGTAGVALGVSEQNAGLAAVVYSKEEGAGKGPVLEIIT